ncbi:T6SS immunity protein Tdi1 domain-containing protein, partial [Actinomyces sp. 565]|uniref:T6SS immunity protein Tdi1 domain-containing protein n=1 Tax=Actinomyces sp. 565 TaxID=2057794 RepID=UPI0013A6F353
WGEQTGHSIEIDPTYSEVIIDQLAIQAANDPEVRQQQGRVVFTGSAKWSVEDPEDASERALPPQALARLGPVSSDQVYGFVLPPVLGGPISVDNLRITDAHTYLTLQAQQSDITISDPVGTNWGQIAPIIRADPDPTPIARKGNS